ncbi:hypothetical protein GWI33_000945 [Rhynchophorus ferrugineus]|uniref:Uncharacterized protein n=1 Tax=Rhynchophorus ferrugineus TaxID=354439 RepID=A0A834ILL9_RHYFE|nr:hypothetical protein GWI33_000945 [Rhynchophorus ferrugineus]
MTGGSTRKWRTPDNQIIAIGTEGREKKVNRGALGVGRRGGEGAEAMRRRKDDIREPASKGIEANNPEKAVNKKRSTFAALASAPA